MRIAITGATGLVGSTLRRAFEGDGDEVVRVVRSRDRARRGTAYWNPDAGEMDERAFEDLDVVIHLAGKSLFSVWTRGNRERIRRSRVQGTQLLASGLAGLERPPALLITASAIGYYGDRPAHEVLDEEASGGEGFLASVVRGWEAASEPAEVAGIRTVQLRLGLVVAREGGIVQKMATPFRFGLGAVVGPGDQAWSWVSLTDLPSIVRHVIATESLRGPVNATAPYPVTAKEFSRTLGRVMRRPVLLHIPEAALSLAPGGMGREMAAASANVRPARLLETGYTFRHATLEAALRAQLSPDR